MGMDSNFCGTTTSGGTRQGGSDGAGTVFKMTPAGQVTTLYKFHTKFDGYAPYAGVTLGPDGALYGTTTYGGPDFSKNNPGYGTVYKLTLPQ